MKNTIILLLFFNSYILNAQITTYSASYGVTGVNLDQPELVFNLETTYESNERFTQLYRWRYALGDYRGLLFEYNNRIYFGKGRDYDNSKWFLQGKVGYGILRGYTYLPGTVYTYDQMSNTFFFNNTEIVDDKHFVFNYGLSLGYKFIVSDRITFDFLMGYTGFKKPKFDLTNPNSFGEKRESDWVNGIGYPIDFMWSIGFLID
jgi:hypothetical protein